jgi:hypothetical protein
MHSAVNEIPVNIQIKWTGITNKGRGGRYTELEIPVRKFLLSLMTTVLHYFGPEQLNCFNLRSKNNISNTISHFLLCWDLLAVAFVTGSLYLIIIPCSRILLQEVTIAHLVKTFHVFHEKRFFTARVHNSPPYPEAANFSSLACTEQWTVSFTKLLAKSQRGRGIAKMLAIEYVYTHCPSSSLMHITSHSMAHAYSKVSNGNTLASGVLAMEVRITS